MNETKAHKQALEVRLRQCDDEAHALTATLSAEQIQRIFADDRLFDMWADGSPDATIIEELVKRDIVADKAEPVEPHGPVGKLCPS